MSKDTVITCICSYIKWLFELECHKYNFSTKIDLDRAIAELGLNDYSNERQSFKNDLSATTSKIPPSADENPNDSSSSDSDENLCEIISMSTRCKSSTHFKDQNYVSFGKD